MNNLRINLILSCRNLYCELRYYRGIYQPMKINDAKFERENIKVSEIDLKMLNQKIKASGPYDKGLMILQEEAWKIADKYGLQGKEVVEAFLDWKSKVKEEYKK